MAWSARPRVHDVQVAQERVLHTAWYNLGVLLAKALSRDVTKL